MPTRQVYVDPSLGSGVGDGTIGNPYGDYPYALATEPANNSGGLTFNLLEGSVQLLTATLPLPNGTVDFNNPWITRGYTAAAGDGGVCEIDMQGNSSPIWPNNEAIGIIDTKGGNTGSSVIARLNRYSFVMRAHLHTTTGAGLELPAQNSRVMYSMFENIGTLGVTLEGQGAYCGGCLFVNGTNQFTNAIFLNGATGAAAYGNMFALDGGSNGINDAANGATVVGNSLLSTGNGRGIIISGGPAISNDVSNNVIEGFATSIENNTSTRDLHIFANNSYTSALVGPEDEAYFWGGNEQLTAPLFDKSGLPTFDNRFAYFNPLDKGSIIGGSLETGGRRDRGAVQSPGGGGTTVYGVARGMNFLEAVRQNETESFDVNMVSNTDGRTPAPGLTLQVELKKQGGGYSVVAPAINDDGGGSYTITPIAAHRDTIGRNAWRITATGATQWDGQERVQIATDQDVAKVPRAATTLIEGATFKRNKATEGPTGFEESLTQN